MESELTSYYRTHWIRRLLALTALFLILAAAPAQSSRAQDRIPVSNTPDWTAPHVPGQLLVKYSNGAAARGTTATLAIQAGLSVQDTIPELGIAVVEATGTATDAELAATATALEASPAIEWVEPNYIFTLDTTPNDLYYPTKQSSYLNRLEMPAAWDYTTGQSDVIIAVLDTGVAMNHPDLASGIWTNPGEDGEKSANGIDDDGNGFIDDVHGWNFAEGTNHIYDDHGHGTHVAGIAAARINNSIGIAGMAGGATIMPVDVFPLPAFGTYEDLIRAIIYATDNGADVINMSLGATSYSLGEEAAVDYAWEPRRRGGCGSRQQ